MGDLISDALSNIINAEKKHKEEVTIKRTSKLLLEIMKIIKKQGYIAGYEYTENNKGGILKVKLINKINKINSIRPRYSCTIDQIEYFEKVYLPATGFGIIMISTSNGLLTHYEAKEKKVGGSLIAYCY
jgi:small subunit ribosomal protein S8